jgi:hypothetical protein
MTMKQTILFVLFIFFIKYSFACDICGCNSGNYFIGPFPQFKSHIVGLRYSFQRFNTVLNSDNTQFSNDFYQTMELMAGTRINNQWQLLAFAPYNIYNSKSDDGIKKNNGFGDITFIGNYNLINSKTLNSDTLTIFQQLWIGGGVKLPTGKYSIDTSELISSANMQVGTGSLDFLINAIYSLQIDNWGLNINSNYKVNQSANDFRFGNRFSTSTFVFRTFNIDKVKISPNIGLLYEFSESNLKDNNKIRDTGGSDLLLAIGFELRFKSISVGSNIQLPIYSDLSSGQTDAKIRAMCNLSFIF